MNIAIAGGSGFIGTYLANHLLSKQHSVTILDRQPPRATGTVYHSVDLLQPLPNPQILAGHDAIIQLSGAPINQRWNPVVKQTIYDSRVKTTTNLVSALRSLSQPPAVFVGASACGYYGHQGENTITELSPAGSDFLSTLCKDWEKAAQEATTLGIRVVNIRTSPVLGKNGLLLQQLLPIYRAGLGGPMGPGTQWFPWVHIEDLIRIYTRAVEDQALQGPINASAPTNVRQQEFAHTFGKALHRPTFFPTPVWAIRLLYNDLADSLVISQKIKPAALENHHYNWKYSQLLTAIKACL